MIIIISSKIGHSDIASSLGKPEYSYYFLMKEFIPALEKIGTVIEAQLGEEVDRIFHRHAVSGEPVFFLSISPPHQTPVNLACPTLSVFAWEFNNFPNYSWNDDPRNDWRYVFQKNGAAITLSTEVATSVKDAMGANFPILATPAPVWDRFSRLFQSGGWLPVEKARSVSFFGRLIDTSRIGLSADGLVQKPVEPAGNNIGAQNFKPQHITLQERKLRAKSILRSLWQETFQTLQPNRPDNPVFPAKRQQTAELKHVVYTSVLNPSDGRKNWTSIITAFCWTFHDNEEATLILKMAHQSMEYYRVYLLTLLSRLSPFKCRVLVIHSYLSDEEYESLVMASDYYVNASSCEGLCLPLMEFLSAGKPAIAPNHTAMADYINPEISFIVRCSVEPACWSHEPTGKNNSQKHRLNWQSLAEEFLNSFNTAKQDKQRYRAMSNTATLQLQNFASTDSVARKIGGFLCERSFHTSSKTRTQEIRA